MNPVCMSRRPKADPQRARGFSLIEVMIAMLLMAFGLLSLGLLQVMNVRYTQSAQHRTMATNLTYELLDLMRSNHAAAQQFGTINKASFSSVTVPATGCTRGTSGTYTDNISRWKCEVVASLPGGSADVTFVGQQVTVGVSWSDDVGRTDSAAPGDVGKPAKTTKFEVTTRL